MGFWRSWFGREEQNGSEYSLPENHTVYAVGDIHGRADLLQKLLSKIDADRATLPDGQKVILVFLGDYIDRGFHSKEVIDCLIALDWPNVELVYLAGNHEDMLLQFLDDPAEGQLWMGVGGLAALASYGVYVAEDCDVDGMLHASQELQQKMPAPHIDFLRNLKEHYRVGDYYFVHAGLRPAIPIEAQRRSDKLGIRREFTKSGYDFGFCVVHGHTGVRSPERHNARIAVDTGAFATGILTAAVVTGSHVSFIST